MSFSLPTSIFIIAQAEGKLSKFWDSYSKSEYIINDFDYQLLQANDSDNIDRLLINNIKPESQNHLILITDIDEAQKKSVEIRLTRDWPTTVIRWWDNIAKIEKNRRNKKIYNRNTGVNIFLDNETLLSSRSGENGTLIIENPYLLTQTETFGEDSEYKMLSHALGALSQPSRIDGLGNNKQCYNHIRLCVATHFYCNQENINSITDLLKEYEKYPKKLLDKIQFVIVDDGSPIEYEIPNLDLNIIWLKINEDIRWNQAGARNLAMLYARTNNVIISDADHMFPEKTLCALVKKNIRHKRFYKFYRQNPDGSLRKGHPNIFYIARSRWFELFGTDEEYAGAYGAEDFRFVKTLKNHGTVQRYLSKELFCIDRKIDRDNSYHSLIRDLSFNTPIDTRKRMEAEYFGENYGHSRINYNFTWDIALDKQREISIVPALDRSWRARWNLRQLKTMVFRG